MNSLLWCLLWGSISFIILRSISKMRSGSETNTESHHEARLFPHRDPFGLDLLYRTAKLMSVHKIIPAFAQWHQEHGETFVVNSLGTPVVHTLSTKNIEVIFESGLKIWGVAPARLEAMAPLCGLGFINTDGDIWKRSRGLIEPAFKESNISGLRPFAAVVDDALRRLPVDGTTVDVSPIIDELVSLHALERTSTRQ